LVFDNVTLEAVNVVNCGIFKYRTWQWRMPNVEGWDICYLL